VLTGYGSSPDERVSLVDLEQRISLNSYRIGAGYFKQFGNQFITGASNYDKSSGIYCINFKMKTYFLLYNINSNTIEIEPHEKILIIEDDSLVIKILDFVLKKEGYETHISRDGADGINQIDILKPDLIITDIMMPYKSSIT
jgi:hypothetical protein